MILKGLIDEDFINYRYPSMVLEFPYCSFKCDKECNKPVCQNSALANEPNIKIDVQKVIDRYINNPITNAICMQGLEPFDSWQDLYTFIFEIRKKTNDDIIIYTGYRETEIQQYILKLKQFQNIIIKFGRFVPDQNLHYDNILGVNLASDNQYAKKIS